MPKTIDDYFRAALYLAFFLMLGLLIYLVVEQKSGQAITLLACALILIAARINDVVRLKLGGGGIEADLQRIRDSLEEVQKLAEVFGAISLQQMQGSGRWGRISRTNEDENSQ